MEIIWSILLVLTLLGFTMIMPRKLYEPFGLRHITGFILVFCGFITLTLLDQAKIDEIKKEPIVNKLSRGEKLLFSRGSDVNPFEADTIIILDIQYGYASFKTSFDYSLDEFDLIFNNKPGNHTSSESVEYLLTHTIKIK